jgi:hypothetical protein
MGRVIGRLDEILKRLFSFFVAPLLNVIIISTILNLCLSPTYSIPALVSQLDFGGITRYITELLTALFSGNFDSLREYMGRFSNQIAAVSTIVAILVFLMIVLVMYLLDRAIYCASWFVPLDFELDLASYAAAHRADARLRRLYALVGQPFDVDTAYGVARSYLGESSIDEERITRRNALARTRATARLCFDYAVSYCFLLSLAWLFALVVHGYFRLAPLTLVLGIALVVAFSSLIWFANAAQDLVEFDIDSFVRLRLYNKQDDRFMPLRETEVALPPPDAGATRGLRGALYLRHQPAGILYAAYVIARRVMSAAFRRK